MFDSRQRLVVLASILASAILIGTIGWISTSTVSLIAVTPCHSEFDAGRAIQYAGVLALNYQNRVTGSDGARRAAEYLRAQFVSLGYQVEDETFAMWLEGQRVSGENVIAPVSEETVARGRPITMRHTSQPSGVVGSVLDRSRGENAILTDL